MKIMPYKNIAKYLLAGCLLIAKLNLVQAQDTPQEPLEHRVYRIKMVEKVNGETKIIDTTFTAITKPEVQDVLKNLKEGESISLSDKIKKNCSIRKTLITKSKY